MVSDEIVEIDTSSFDHLRGRHHIVTDELNMHWFPLQGAKEPPPDMMSNACIARILWLMADMETEKGKAFWNEAERGK